MVKNNNWEEVKLISSKTGQGLVYLVKPIDSTKYDINKKYVLKELKNQKDFERRTRMYREVSNLKSLNHKGVQKVVDTNIYNFENLNEKLYFVYEYVEGKTLSDYILERELNFSEKLLIIQKILDVLNYCHSQTIIHRDIKPDNIIIQDNLDIVLIDFGLSFNKSNNDNLTETKQDLGNKFLYLPELNSNRDTKRDERSDLTYCCGILFFLITKKFPKFLTDESERKPHQRINMTDFVEQNKIKKLNKIFDIGFRTNINKRYQSVEELQRDIEMLKFQEEDDANITLRSCLNRIVSDNDLEDSKQIYNNLNFVSACLHEVVCEIQEQSNGVLGSVQTGYNMDLRECKFENVYGLNTRRGIKIEFTPKCSAYIDGSQTIVKMIEKEEEEIFRFGMNEYKTCKNELKEAITKYYLISLDEKIKCYNK